MARYTRVRRDGAELLEMAPLAPAQGRPDGRPCTEQDHAEALGDIEHLEYRQVPGSPDTFVACRYCGAIIGVEAGDK